MTDQERSEWIEKYIQGELAGEALKAFELQLQSVPELAIEVALQKDILQALTEKDVIDFRETLEKIANETPQTIPSPRRVLSLGRILILAAAVISLVIAGNWIYTNLKTTSNSPEDVYASYFTLPDELEEFEWVRGDTSSGRGSELDSSIPGFILLADSLYQIKDYEGALDILKELPPRSVEDYQTAISYRLGLLSMITNQHEAALSHFQKVVTNYQTKSKWYTALTLLKVEGKLEQAKETFEAIAKTKNPYQNDAKAILKALEK